MLPVRGICDVIPAAPAFSEVKPPKLGFRLRALLGEPRLLSWGLGLCDLDLALAAAARASAYAILLFPVPPARAWAYAAAEDAERLGR
jgi:hypothetical protein